MGHYVALHITDCIIDWAIKAIIIHAINRSLSSQQNWYLDFWPNTHTVIILHRLWRSRKKHMDQYTGWLRFHTAWPLFAQKHQMPPPETRCNSLWDEILRIHFLALKLASQGQKGWMLKCFFTSGKRSRIQSQKGWAITTSPASEECTIVIKTQCHPDNDSWKNQAGWALSVVLGYEM